MQIIKDKNKIRRQQTENLIVDPTFDFNIIKKLNMQSLSKKFFKNFQKSTILNASK